MSNFRSIDLGGQFRGTWYRADDVDADLVALAVAYAQLETRYINAKNRGDALAKERDQLRAAVIRISRAPVYEEPRKKESGISVAITSAIMDAVLLANGGKMPPLEREPRGDDIVHTGFCNVLVGPCPCPRRDGKPRA